LPSICRSDTTMFEVGVLPDDRIRTLGPTAAELSASLMTVEAPAPIS